MTLRVDIDEHAPLSIRHQSPDGRWWILLECLDEVRFGPPYYRPWVHLPGGPWWSPDGPRVFGEHLAFLADSTGVVMEAWGSLITPDVSIVLLDVVAGTLDVVDVLGPRLPVSLSTNPPRELCTRTADENVRTVTLGPPRAPIADWPWPRHPWP